MLRSFARTARPAGVILAALAALLVWSVAAVPAPASAADNGSWSVEPTSPKLEPGATPRQYFVYDLAPGRELHDSVTIANETRVAQNFDIYAADGFTTARDGSLGLSSVGDPQRGVGSWVHVARASVTVPPKHEVVVPFTVRVPLDAEPGDHVGGVVALNKQITLDPNAGTPIGVQKAVAARVYTRVQGPVTVGLEIRRVWIDRSGPKPLVHYVLANVGSLRQNPTVDVTLSGLLGHDQHLPPMLVRDLLPHSESEFTAVAASLPSLDYVNAAVSAASGTATADGSTHVLLVPWWVWALLALLVLLLVAELVRRARRGRSSRVPSPTVEGPAPAAVNA